MDDKAGAKKKVEVKKKDLDEVVITPSKQVELNGGKVPSLTKFHGYKLNPFTHNMVKEGIAVRGVLVNKVSDKIVTDVKTGDKESFATIGVRTTKDTGQFIKFYTNNWHVLFALKPSSAKLVMMLMAVMQTRKAGTDQIQISYPLLNEICKDLQKAFPEHRADLKMMSEKSFYTAMRELLANDFIAPVHLARDSYWINSAYLFNGDRLNLVNQIDIDRSNDAARFANAGINADARPLQVQGNLSDQLDDASPYSTETPNLEEQS